MAIDTNQTDFAELLVKAIERGLREMVEQKYEELKKEFLEKLERDKDRELAGIVLNITKTLDYQQMRDRLIITLKSEKQSPN